MNSSSLLLSLNTVITAVEMGLDGKTEACQSKFSLILELYTAVRNANDWSCASCILSGMGFQSLCVCSAVLYV